MSLVDEIIVPCCAIGLLAAFAQFLIIRKISLTPNGQDLSKSLTSGDAPEKLVPEIYAKIMDGAIQFIKVEYAICCLFCVLFSGVIYGLVSWGTKSHTQGALTAGAFLTGAFTSMLCGFLGMMIATFSNARTTLACAHKGYTEGFNTAFRGGSVMGYALCSLGVFVLWVLLTFYRKVYPEADDWEILFDCAAGYGLGGSTVAMFGRVGGGIYTKAADVGADLVGKVVAGLDEDDPNNPATIADNVGDNVGDIAGMGADLFGSFAESTCAALVIAAAAVEGSNNTLSAAGWDAMLFPVAISAAGIVICILCGFFATNISPVKVEADIEKVLKIQMVLTAILMLPVIYYLAVLLLPEHFRLEGVRLTESGHQAKIHGSPFKAFICATMGCVGGLIIGLVTEYFTSHSFIPTRELASACKFGTAVNIIQGLALGYKSCIVPVFVLSSAIFVSFQLCDLYGIALAALGMLATLSCGLTIDGFGPISDNAGGIAEMALFNPEVRRRTDALDAAGNTTAAIGKGFAIGSAALVSLALYGAFVIRLRVKTGVNILEPTTFAFLIIGCMIPYWFAALTMKSVGKAAGEMVAEVQRQFSMKDSKGKTLLTGSTELKPDSKTCIQISTQASIREMVAPACLVILSPLAAGTFFGVQAVFGLLTGSLGSSVQLAISMSNSGGAWDNCKKFIKNGFSDDVELLGIGH
ncbi:Pyrophosphate-energized vacuolar membrane proton pump (Pyrophosphate-energized inorganic pyrophosphatase) (H(+)-PPase) [Durusdinium trenchii]|uniref:H(+)-exporting diphosphatase n=1 Tax=Durusdinium trenchii TaxID=1381693 RepID=A0ABP0QIK1_9DINO